MATSEVPYVWRKGNITPVFKKSSKNIMKWILLEVMTGHVKDREMIRDSQRGCTMGKSCLSNLWPPAVQ